MKLKLSDKAIKRIAYGSHSIDLYTELKAIVDAYIGSVPVGEEAYDDAAFECFDAAEALLKYTQYLLDLT